MNRCTIRPTVARLEIVFALALSLSSLAASAQPRTLVAPTPAAPQFNTPAEAGRPFPPQALRGKLLVVAPPDIRIDGRPERLSPGARIRDFGNMVVMSGQLVGREFVVNFTRGPGGLVHEVWILTEAEAKLERPLATPRRNFFFASEGEQPKVDDGKTPYNQLPGYGPAKR